MQWLVSIKNNFVNINDIDETGKFRNNLMNSTNYNTHSSGFFNQ